MGELKYKYKDLFRGGKLVRRFLYKEFEDLQDQINNIEVGDVDSFEVTVKSNVDLTAQALGNNFGAASSFKGIGVVKNSEGTYLVVSDGSAYKTVTLDDL